MEPLVVVGSKAQAFLVSYKTLATFFTPTPGDAAFGRMTTPMTRGEVAIRLQKRWALKRLPREPAIAAPRTACSSRAVSGAVLARHRIIGRGRPLVGDDKAAKNAASRSGHALAPAAALTERGSARLPDYATSNDDGGGVALPRAQLTSRRACDYGPWRPSGKRQMAAQRRFTAHVYHVQSLPAMPRAPRPRARARRQ